MYLLCYDEERERPTLVKRFGRNIPPYAVLSHTWGPEEEEVTLQDILQGRYADKPAYKKVEFCLGRAAADGLRHCWVDTCCIDRSSSADLSEAINSMFSYYQKAEKCYVYMADVSTAEGDGSGTAAAFRRSRWFTRGWTLQELIAPAVVEFYSAERELIGDKRGMEEAVSAATGIPASALRGRELFRFGVEERLGWAAGRETSREEDAAYSLLGVFEVFLPLIYGEGARRAMIRLRRAIEESFDEPQDPPRDYLTMGQRLTPGQFLKSRNEKYVLTLRADGNLVLEGPEGQMWESGTGGREDVRDIIMQHDGNLVIYTQAGEAIWDSYTYPVPKTKLIVQDDGNVVIYSYKEAQWDTGTYT